MQGTGTTDINSMHVRFRRHSSYSVQCELFFTIRVCFTLIDFTWQRLLSLKLEFIIYIIYIIFLKIGETKRFL